MIFDKLKSLIKKNYIFYLIGFVIIFGIKYFYSKAGSNELEWILAPTAWWVRILSGIPFEREPSIGYISHQFRFIIAPSCSGVQFMIITIATLIYSYVHRMNTIRRGFGWVAFSLGTSYLLTIIVNGFRIVTAIHLPIYFYETNIHYEWMTPEKLHTLIGIIVYFTSLFIIYHVAGYISMRIAGMEERTSGSMIPPMFWYFAIALGIPFLNRAYENNGRNFVEYAILMLTVCSVIMFLFYLLSMIRKYINKQKNKG